jgi:hypothetical protein
MTTTTTTTTNASAGRQRPGRLWLLALALTFLGSPLLAGACSHQHLNPNYGMSYNAWFTAQHVRHEPSNSEATRRALGSLDAQEAASISKNYRRTSGGGDVAGQGQMVMIGQSRGGMEGYTPPPSVPGGN